MERQIGKNDLHSTSVKREVLMTWKLKLYKFIVFITDPLTFSFLFRLTFFLFLSSLIAFVISWLSIHTVDILVALIAKMNFDNIILCIFANSLWFSDIYIYMLICSVT